MNQKWLNTMKVFDEYERRFASARAHRPFSSPWQQEDRERILDQVKKMLGYREEWIPEVAQPKEISRQEFPTHSCIQYRFSTWNRFYSCGTLYLPKNNGPLPLVLICCGHGEKGRLSASYVAMGQRLAKLGIAALALDNIGQGDRNFFPDNFKSPSHWNSIAPFYCNTTLQGLIVMETLGILRAMEKDERFDPKRLGACGNSGGGTLTLFLAALAPELAALSSSGYPSEFSYLLSKERNHCSCNLLRGCANGPEMWEIYSLFAPKPLLLEGGKFDNLIPMDLAHRNARKVQNSYLQQDAENAFSFTLTSTKHSWEATDLNLISDFLARHLLGIEAEPEADYDFSLNVEDWHVALPEDRIDTDEMVQDLTGIKMPSGIRLSDVFPPRYQGNILHEETVCTDVGRGDVMQFFAQMECALFSEQNRERK